VRNVVGKKPLRTRVTPICRAMMAGDFLPAPRRENPVIAVWRSLISRGACDLSWLLGLYTLCSVSLWLSATRPCRCTKDQPD
jgi:hypothetical protein